MTIRKLPGSQIESNTITITQIQTTAVTTIVTQAGPRVSSLVYPGNDTAGNTVGGQTVYINGSGFETNNAIYINGNAVPSKSFISASNLSFTTPALAAGIYPVYVINTDSGATAIFVPGYISSAEPTWVTSAGSLSESQDELSAWSYSLSATGDAPITYALAAGSSLPTGISLAANGLISGTISSPTGNVTTYTFSVVATDAQNQDSTRQFTVTTATGEGVLFANNVLLIHADGTNNQNNHAFLDSSNNNFTITRYGNASQGTFSPFSQTGWSNYFDGTGDYLSIADNAALQMGSGNFTIEYWWYPNNITGYQTPYDKGYTNAGGLVLQTGNGDGRIIVYASGSAVVTSNTAVVSNSWTHMALVRNGTNLTLYQNGISVGSATNSTNFNNASTTGIGANIGGSTQYPINGYISNFRMLKGTALYTSGFTPSTTPLTAVSNTSLLTCQSNRFIDNSTNVFTITRNGDTSIQAWSPFAPTAAYTTANVGGSVYFDGTGDYLTVPDNVALESFTDFTIEFWVYFNSVSGTQVVVDKGWNGASISPYLIFLSSGSLIVYASSSGSSWDVLSGSSFGTMATGQWYHIALTRSGSSIRLFTNGSLITTVTNSSTLIDSASALGVGASPSAGANPLNGYLSGLRIVKGTAVYTSAFTPPTAPVTNIANTSLLCNFTNAGIFDQTAKNVLETVGDAKVSTAQFKYGTGSISFDGTSDYIKILKNATLLNFGAGDFTVETWVRFNTVGADQAILGSDGTTGAYDIAYRSGQGLSIGRYNTAWDSTFSWSPSINTWYHIVWCRSGSSLRAFVDGVQIGSTATNTNAYNGGTNYSVIGASDASNTRSLNGFLDDLRITKGYARYTSNFTAPTAALKDK